MKNSTIGIICAMDKEMDHYKEVCKDYQMVKYMEFVFYVGEYNSNKLILTKCGVGKVNAASLTTILIEHFKPDLVINTGVAGGFDKDLKTLDIVCADSVFYHDVDCRFGDDLRYGQVQNLPLVYRPCILLTDRISKLDFSVKFGAVATGDQFITNYEEVKNKVDTYFKDLKVMAFDMESGSIAQVCHANHTEFLIIRAISDLIGSNNVVDYNNFVSVAANKAAKLVFQLIDAD